MIRSNGYIKDINKKTKLDLAGALLPQNTEHKVHTALSTKSTVYESQLITKTTQQFWHLRAKR